VCMCVCARVKNTVYMEYGTICGFSYLPGVLECIPQGLGELLYFLSLLFPHLSVSQQCHYWELTRHDLLPGITDQLLIPLSAAPVNFPEGPLQPSTSPLFMGTCPCTHGLGQACLSVPHKCILPSSPVLMGNLPLSNLHSGGKGRKTTRKSMRRFLGISHDGWANSLGSCHQGGWK
jgi:hypothetical protein